MFGNKINAIKFTWDITKPTPELYEPPVNPKTELKKDYNKFKKELPVVNRATEKTAIEYQKKQEENQKKSQEIEKEINEKYSNYPGNLLNRMVLFVSIHRDLCLSDLNIYGMLSCLPHLHYSSLHYSFLCHP